MLIKIHAAVTPVGKLCKLLNFSPFHLDLKSLAPNTSALKKYDSNRKVMGSNPVTDTNLKELKPCYLLKYYALYIFWFKRYHRKIKLVMI